MIDPQSQCDNSITQPAACQTWGDLAAKAADQLIFHRFLSQ